MSLSRRAIPSVAPVLRHQRTTALRTPSWRRAGQSSRARGYATGSGGPSKQSDIPWLLGSIGITVPTLWYIGIWQPDPNAHHGHEEHHEEHVQDNAEDGEDADKSADDEKAGDEEQASGQEQQDEGEPKAQDDEESKHDGDSDKQTPNESEDSSNDDGDDTKSESKAKKRHSTDVENDKNKSSKAEGGPDTARFKGTVDPSRNAK